MLPHAEYNYAMEPDQISPKNMQKYDNAETLELWLNSGTAYGRASIQSGKIVFFCISVILVNRVCRNYNYREKMKLDLDKCL